MNRKRILIIDDEESFTRMLKLNLDQTDRYEARVVNWPEMALGAAREFQPHLVFLDVLMPRMVGGDVAALLRADPLLKDVPIVFFTAAVRNSIVREHGGVVDGDPILTKPASFEEVIACLEKHLPN